MPRGIHSKIVFTLPYMVMSIPNMVLWVILFAKVKNHVFCRTVPKWWGCVDSVSFNPPFMMGTPNRTQVTLRSQCQCAITSFFFLVKSGPKLPRGYNVSVPLHLFFFFLVKSGPKWPRGYNVCMPLHLFFFFLVKSGPKWSRGYNINVPLYPFLWVKVLPSYERWNEGY